MCHPWHVNCPFVLHIHCVGLSTTSYSVTMLVIRISVLGQCYNCSIVLVNYNQRYLSIGKNPKKCSVQSYEWFQAFTEHLRRNLEMREALYGKNVRWKQRLPTEYQGLPRPRKLGGGLGGLCSSPSRKSICQQLISVSPAL